MRISWMVYNGRKACLREEGAGQWEEEDGVEELIEQGMGLTKTDNENQQTSENIDKSNVWKIA